MNFRKNVRPNLNEKNFENFIFPKKSKDEDNSDTQKQ